MNEQDLYDVLQSFQSSIQMLQDKLAANDERFHSLESMIFDDIINPAKKAMDDADRQDRFDDFYSRNGERLDAFDQPLKTIEGDENFSLAKQAFNDYDALEEPKPEESEYVDALVDKVEAQINEIKSSLGLPADADVAVEQDGETGEVEVKVDGQPVETEEGAEAPVEETVSEEVVEEPAEENAEEGASEDTEANHDKELADLYDELEKSIK